MGLETVTSEIELLRRRNRELEALNAIATTVSTSLQLDHLLAAALTQVIELVGFDTGSVYLIDAHTQRLNLCASRGWTTGRICFEEQADLRNPLLAHIALAEIPIHFSGHEIPAVPLASLLRGPCPVFRAAMLLPLRAKGKTVGLMITLTSDVPKLDMLNPETLTAIGNQIGMAIENACLYEAERQAHLTAATLRQALTSVTSTLELSEVLSRVLDQLSHVFAFVSAAVMLQTYCGFVTILAKNFGLKFQ